MDVLTFKLPAVLHRDQRRGGDRGRWPGQGPPARRVAAEAGCGGRVAGLRSGGVQAAAPGGEAGGDGQLKQACRGQQGGDARGDGHTGCLLIMYKRKFQ